MASVRRIRHFAQEAFSCWVCELAPSFPHLLQNLLFPRVCRAAPPAVTVRARHGHPARVRPWGHAMACSYDIGRDAHVTLARLRETSQLTTLFAPERFLPFQADDRNRNQRGGGVYPADMKHRIED